MIISDIENRLPLIKKILNSSFFLLVGNSVGRLCVFIANLIAARLFSQELFGQYALIRSTVNSVENIVSGSIGTVTIRNISKTSLRRVEDLPILVGSTILVNMFVVAIFAVLIIFLHPKS